MGDNLITLKKVLTEGGTIAGVSFLTYLVDTGFEELTLGYPEYILIIGLGSALTRGFLNWWKHKDD